ncbi:helicase [Halobacteriales archaeon QS_4_69_34]|nr:MAG: helicase [Halobacteriales archaeon QS_4_69_34]
MNPARLDDEFPAPSYRGAQKRALGDIQEAFAAGNDAVLVRAPTGSGKSLLARAVAGGARRPDEAGPTEPTGAYYTTPQVSQLDDAAADPLLSDLQVVRGKRNYSCLLPGETDTPVDRAPCVRETGFDCSVQHRCPYFSDRAIAANRSIAAMTLAYFMQTAGSAAFGRRDVVVIDEAHGLAEWAEMYATIDLRPRTVPVWEALSVPDLGDTGSLGRAVQFAEQLVDVCERRKNTLVGADELTPAEVAERDRLQELVSDLEWFVADAHDPESATTWLVDQPDGADGAVTIKPLNPERYLHHTVWDRGERFALLSATILDKNRFCRGVGLDPDRVALVDVPHTFPVEHRPLYDVTQGKMTYEHRAETLPEISRLLVRLMARHPDERGIVHAHSYAIAEDLADRLAEFGVGERVRTHGREDRDAQLRAWLAGDASGDDEVFVSVKMEEALDLGGDLARWQVLCKAPYANTRDSRVARRLEEGRWAWYYRTALSTVIQACGRVVRSPDDFGATYLADVSLLDCFERARGDMPDWFREQVDRMGTPELPAFDPSAALGESSGSDATGGGDPRRGRSARVGRDGRGGHHSDAESHPLADVWDTE